MVVDRIDAVALSNEVAVSYIKFITNERFGQPPQSIKYLGGGSFGSAYLINLKQETIVIKFLRANGMLEKEVVDLRLLASKSSVKIPKVLFSRPLDQAIPIDCYAMEYIEGASAFNIGKILFLSKRKRTRFADCVTTALHKIHNCTSQKFGDTINPDCDSWLDFYRPFAKAIYDKAEELYDCGELPKKVIFAMRAAWEKFEVIFAEQVNSACLIHGDLNIANIMVDKKYNLTGFIDPLNSMYADREYDLFQFDNIGGKRFSLRKTYIKKYGASKNCDAKSAFYGLWNEVYCYIKSGVLIGVIMKPLIKNMKKQLRKL